MKATPQAGQERLDGRAIPWISVAVGDGSGCDRTGGSLAHRACWSVLHVVIETHKTEEWMDKGGRREREEL